MFDSNGFYSPPSIPDEDKAALNKLREGRIADRYGLGEGMAMVVVDMTRGFVEDRFATGWETTGVPCSQSIRRLLDFVRQHPIPVFHTRPVMWTNPTERGRWSKGAETTGELKRQPEDAYEFYPDSAPQGNEIIIEKQKPSAFFASPLQPMLTFHRIDTLIVTGMVTSGCIRATVTDSFSHNFRTIVPLECVADRSQTSHEVELFDMAAKYADVVPLDSLLDDLKQWVETHQAEQVAVRR